MRVIITRKENQRTLAFNVAIQDLAIQKTVFSGSSSEKELMTMRMIFFKVIALWGGF